MAKKKKIKTLADKYPPSSSCSCEICLNYCVRPGWWTVKEAEKAIELGYADRMMLEMAPEMTFGVLSPAFKGCEADYAMNIFAQDGCNFLIDGKCLLFGTGVQPLECRFCHHDRIGLGKKCHLDIENDWNSDEGRALVTMWAKIVGLLEKRNNFSLY